MLKRISLRGFKSFADPINLDLGPGLNVIVGPNGSGKSNLAESIVWALGEQRAGKLRAPGMQDMLYSGSGNRPAAGFAEIGLHFDADESGARPEIEVSRRLTRNGDAVYRIGSSACRLLDLQEALSVRGLGTDSLAVIRQGQVEAIATSKPDALRGMLDEAAGVGVAKRRRKRAEQKLTRIADQLDRARDLATELGGRAKALERQARAAERAAELELRIESLRERERLARAVAAASQLQAAQSANSELTQVDQAAQSTLDAARTARDRAVEARAAATGALERADAMAQVLRAATERITGRAELASERVSELESRQERLGAAKADAARRLVELEAAERDVAAEIVAVTQALEAAQQLLGGAEQDELAARGAEMEASERVRRAGAELASAQGALTDARHRADQAEAAMARADEALAGLASETEIDLGRDERRADIAERRLQRDHGRVDAAQVELDEVTGELRAAEQRVREAAAAARLLAPETKGANGPSVLGDGLEVERGTERAVAAAIGALAEAMIGQDLETARQAIADGVANVVIPAAPIARMTTPQGARPLVDVITVCPDHTRPHVERLLTAAWMIDDFASVPSDHDGVFVTADGVAFVPRTGVVSAARGEWAKRALHKRAVEEEAALREVVDQVAARVTECTAARERIRRRRAASERALRRVSTALSSRRASSAAVIERRERLQIERDESGRLRDDARRAAEDWLARSTVCERDLADSHTALSAARERLAAAAAELDTVRAAVRDARAAGSAVDARAGEVQSAAASARALLGAGAALPGGLELVARAAGALGAVAAALEPTSAVAREALTAERATFTGVEQELAAAHRHVEAAEGGSREARERLHSTAVELRLAEERVAEAGPVTGEVPEEPLDPVAVAEELADLERRRLNIGAVNELAAQERTELAEREQHLTEQIDDLQQSSESLAAHLGELDNAVDEGFEAIFTAVSERFAEVVGWLFPGGTGRLRLVEPEDEDGEQGVLVEVVPANKRPRPMSLMSGGERSLIAMAFMLSLAMARPAPFYLLDEVEAALDDANLRRFLGVLRRLAGETQFIVITHQQPTVEIADTLFGVTMGANGVSQILSRRLAQTVEGPARPYVRRQLRLVGS
jgi:chromosome segregation protein